MDYRGFGLAWLVLWLLTAPAWAQPVTVGALALNPAEVWQRASGPEEGDLDSVVLRLGSGPSALEVFLPQQRARLKTSESQFYEQLELGWRRRYGGNIAMEWLSTAGARWRICRRPSRSGDGQVFQIVTVHGGEVYQLLAAAPAATEALPIAVKALLAGAAWDGAAPKGVPEADVALVAASTALAEPSPAPGPVPVEPAPAAEPAGPAGELASPRAGPTPATPAPTAPAPTAAAPAASAPAVAPAAAPPAKAAAVPAVETWRLLRSVLALPGRQDWSALAEAEGRLLGTDGPITGLYLNAAAGGLDGFLEGYLWHKLEGGQERRQTFRRDWRIRWPGLPDTWRSDEPLGLGLELAARVSGLDAPGDLLVDLEVVRACAARKAMVAWLDRLESAGPAALTELDRLACRAEPGSPVAATLLVAGSEYADAPASRRIQADLPAPWLREMHPGKGEVARLVAVLRFRTSAAGNASGDALFGKAAAVFVFGP